MKKWVKNLILVIVISFLTILLEISLARLAVKEENIFLVFVVAVIIILIETKNIWYGIIVSVVLVMSFNFFLTEPYYSFVVDDANYYVSFAIFFLVSIIVGSLVTKLQRQILISKNNEKRISAMYNFTNQFLNTQGEKEIYQIVLDYLEGYFNSPFTIITDNYSLFGKFIEKKSTLIEAFDYSIKKNIIVGAFESKYSDLDYKIFPIESKMFKFGALLVFKKDLDFNFEEKEFINNIIHELVVVLDRERILVQQQTTKVQMEKEKFKTSLLRSLSHDLKTPLTSIQSGSNFLYESFANIDDASKKALILDIYQQSCELSDFVANLLNMTRLDDSKKLMNPRWESVDDIIYNVNKIIQRRLTKKNELIIEQSKELLMVYTEAPLLTQVLVNLIDNANKHTKPGTKIVVSYYKTDKDSIFIVSDNGGGIKENIIPFIFDDFYSLTSKQDHARSNGLGLSICKSIIEAHGGEIKAINNNKGGATFTFNIPFGGDYNNE